VFCPARPTPITRRFLRHAEYGQDFLAGGNREYFGDCIMMLTGTGTNVANLTSAHNRALLYSGVLAIVFVGVAYLWQVDKGLNLADEGFLWYGSQRVVHGDVPIRDFMAYDPGRYYWSAAFMRWWGDSGILALRGAVMLFQAAGLFVALLLITTATRKASPLYLAFAAAILLAWMLPRHKLFDISVSIFLIGALAYLAAAPALRRYFFAGVCVGLVAVFGRNHGVYSVFGSVLVMLALSLSSRQLRPTIRGLQYWLLGIVVGYSPLLLLALIKPGFVGEFVSSVTYIFEVKATNLALPIPWPWTVEMVTDRPIDAAGQWLVGLFFLAVGAYAVTSSAWLLWQGYRRVHASPALIACAALSVPYAHYAYSRADVFHLAQGIFPLLVGMLTLLASRSNLFKWSAAIPLLAFSLWVTLPYHPGWRCAVLTECRAIDAAGDNLSVEPSVADDVALIGRLVEQYAPNGRSFVVTPLWPAAYALHERESPMWLIYTIFPRSLALQMQEIERIKQADPGFVLIFDHVLDGRLDLRFEKTHALIAHFIEATYAPVADATANPAYLVFAGRKEE
jgi:hypothetical protein